MADDSDAGPDAEEPKQRQRRKKTKQTASAATDAPVRGTELREANERLILAALRAETIAENAVTHLDELAHLSKHDALTGTPNRELMLDRLENAIALAKRHGTRIGVLFLDLDEFKQINDTFGHAVGDAAVQMAARRVESEVRESDTISRHGGDEFLVLLAEITQPSDAALVAEKILAALAAPSRIDNHQISLSASIGIALFPDDGTDVATLIAHADAAMYGCKKHGGGNFQFYGDARISAHDAASPPRATFSASPIMQRSRARRILRETNEQLVLSALAARKLAEQIRRKHAQQVNSMTMVAQELRNALTPIETATGLLDGARTQDVIDDVQDLLKSRVAHMSRLVDDLLASALAQPSAGRRPECSLTHRAFGRGGGDFQASIPNVSNPARWPEGILMDTIHLTHASLAAVEPGSLVLSGPTDTEAEQYFSIAVHRPGESAARLVSFRADRGSLRAVRTELSAAQAPERLVMSLGRHFTVEPNLHEQVRTDFHDQSALKPGDLLLQNAQQLLVVAPATDKPPLVLDLAGGEVTELPAASVAVVTHWNIYVRNGGGQIICLVDTKSHKQPGVH